ncbi:universal stress protein [Lactobacillus sp. YT155]|uniref:universal stress protein n=1 Tax=Lactobacillus sp. YT155 TaxID=3060955 RepID=UPI00265DAE4E|nr:universal stress protein [Lactobacillus sp. YT155]MDO1605745.1 universal stress protein [Lactobacillus sp. YT155]
MDNENLDEYIVEPLQYNKILVCVDDDDFISSKGAFNYACTLAKSLAVPLGIISVMEVGDLNIFQSLSPQLIEERREQIKDHLNVYVQKANDFGVADVKPMVSEGNPGHVIVDKVIPKYDPDLVIIGSERSDNRHGKLGSQAEHIVRYSPVSVSVVR